MTARYEELEKIVRILREKCPWDREQTNDSIKYNTIEEAYEVLEAIDEKNYDELKIELGDLLLHVIFHSVIAEQDGKFKVEDVVESIIEKLIKRHPHVFGELKVDNSDQVKTNWEKLKIKEGRKSIVDGVPKNLSQLVRAERLQYKAAKVGFDWKKKEDVVKKIEEELNELKEAINLNNYQRIEEEIGDLLFSVVNLSRFVNIIAEEALKKTNEKFIRRFQYVEKRLKENGKSPDDSNLEEMDKYWNESKKKI